MRILICPCCAKHLKKPIAVCPDCGIVAEPAYEEEEDDLPVRRGRAMVPETPDVENRYLRNPHPFRSFIRAFLIVTGLLALSGWADERLGNSNGSQALERAPVAGFFVGLLFAAFGQAIAGMYEAIAGPEPRRFLRAQAKRPQADPIQEPRRPGPFYPTLFLVLALVFALGYDSAKTITAGMGMLLVFGVPLGSLLGGLLVRWSRPSRP